MAMSKTARHAPQTQPSQPKTEVKVSLEVILPPGTDPAPYEEIAIELLQELAIKFNDRAKERGLTPARKPMTIREGKSGLGVPVFPGFCCHCGAVIASTSEAVLHRCGGPS